MNLPAGTAILCPKRHVIGTLKVEPVGQVFVKDIDFAPGQEKVPGQEMTCAVCGLTYMLHGNVYTGSDWGPGEVQTEKVRPVATRGNRRGGRGRRPANPRNDRGNKP